MAKSTKEKISDLDLIENQELFTVKKTEDELKTLLKPSKLIRIAVSGDVLITEVERAIVDQPDFQRLRRLKQLGSAYLVFPTAIHTRFEHSLGALFMVDKMIQNIRENRHNDRAKKENNIRPAEEILARLFALLHDITHIPFGHTLEDEFRLWGRHDEDISRTQIFVGEGSPIGDIISKELGSDIHVRLLKLMKFNKKNDENLRTLGDDSVAYDLVSNTVCADLLDYLKRDHFYCNLPLGLEYRFLNFLYVYQDTENHTKRVAVRLWKAGQTSARIDILNELVALLEYRYKLAEVVYFHHTKLISGTMLAAAVYREKLTKEELYYMGDDELIFRLKKSSNPIVQKLINNFDNRCLWKEVCKKTNLDIQKEDGSDSTLDFLEEYKKDFYENPENRYINEQEISKFLGMQDGDFLLNCPNPKMQLKYAEMKVFWKGRFRELSKCKGEEIELIIKKLNLILESHENLFTIRGYINYEFLNREKNTKDKIIDKIRDTNKAFDHLLSYTRNSNKERDYVQVIVKNYIESSLNVSEISHDTISNLEIQALNRILEPADLANPEKLNPKNRPYEFVAKIIMEEAKKIGINEKL